MPRVNVTVDELTEAKMKYVMRSITHDRSLSALANKAIIHYLRQFPNPPEDGQTELDIN